MMLLLAYEVGFTTPPFGLLLFVMLGVAPKGTKLGTVALAAAPFVGLTILLIIIIAAFPPIAMWLPGVMGR
jgi:TRAP-type C4-dicarboxylate transport system permease large subunit